LVRPAVGFAPREQLAGGFVESITREGFAISHDISAYSLAALAKAGLPMMEGRNGAILTLTYNAAQQVVPNYNVMGLAKASLESCVRFLAADLGPKGIRVNAISFRKMLNYAEKASPLRRTVTIEEVGNTAAFLCSDLASGVTGETTFVDAGANIMGMVFDED
jgi:enoyl-[acyl-carrier protein] reductase I